MSASRFLDTAEMTTMDSNLLTYAAAARYLSTPVPTLRSMVHRKQIPCIRLGPRSVRFRRETLDAWLAKREHPANDQAG